MEKNQAIEIISKHIDHCVESGSLVEQALIMAMGALTQPEYEPVMAEDLAKTMSENTLYSFIAWYGKALDLMEKYGFTICKKTIQPGRPVFTGQWVPVPRHEGDTQPDLECPFCKHKIGWFDMGKYCAKCGAKLKGGAG